MPTITSVKPQKGKGRVNVYLDDKFGFGLDLENFVKLGLTVGRDLTDSEVDEIIQKNEFQKIYSRLINFATVRPRSEKEIENWFKRKKVEESLINKLHDRLERLELTGDEKFAKWWVEQRIAFKNKSMREITAELRLKGIERENFFLQNFLHPEGIHQLLYQ